MYNVIKCTQQENILFITNSYYNESIYYKKINIYIKSAAPNFENFIAPVHIPLHTG